MASWVFCNCCFQPPQRASSFSVTSCGHVYCHICLSKGRKDECLICKAPCRVLLLSKNTDWDIQALFMQIDRLCSRYSREMSQILEFQERHRKRLLTFYQEKISKLEDSLRKSVLHTQQLQRVEHMDVDLIPSPMRKPELALGPARISLISPPQGGRMGSVSHQPQGRPRLTPTCPPMPQSLRSSALPLLSQNPSTPTLLGSSTAGRGTSPSLSSSCVSVPRLPISISRLLQRQNLGSSDHYHVALER